MQLQSLLIVASATVGLGFRVPAGTPDGFYRAFVDESGHEVHEPVNEDMLRRATPESTAGFRASPKMSKRQTYWDVWCGCGISVVSTECDAAVADLKNQVGDDGIFIAPGTSYYSISGSTIAFGCNPGLDIDGYITSSTITTITDRLTSDCGAYIAGSADWYREGTTSTIAVTGYMQYTDGLDFCTAATSSSASSC